jgi:hypothetical protein
MWLSAAGVFFAIGYSAYLIGSALAEREMLAQRAAIDRLKAQVDADKATNEHLETDLAQARQATVTLQQRYDDDVPKAGLAALVTILRQMQGAGIKDYRIAQVLREIDAPRPCSAKVTRRRIPIAMKAPGPDDVVSFLDGLVQVSASMPAGPDGTTKAATVTISRAWAAEPIKVTGLPVQQVITIYNTDLSLVVAPSIYVDSPKPRCQSVAASDPRRRRLASMTFAVASRPSMSAKLPRQFQNFADGTRKHQSRFII